VPVVVTHRLVEPDAVAAWQAPRTDVVTERPVDGPGGDHAGADTDPGSRAVHSREFTLAGGPFHEWERRVEVGLPSPDQPGVVPVTETVRYRLAVPVWGALFAYALRRRLRHGPRPAGGPPWWAPPEVIDARAATVLSLLCVLGAFGGYLGTLVTQTITYAARQFDASTTDQGTLLASVRIGVLLSLVVVAVADRRGRRVVLLAAVVGSAVVTAMGALAPGMVWLGTTQTFARALTTVVALLIGIIAIEEMPSGARAFAISVLAMTAALGAGACVANLLYADVAEGAWRVAYLLPLLVVVPILRLGRGIPETRRFERHRHGEPTARPPADPPPAPTLVGEAGVDGSNSPAGRRRVHGVDWGRFVLLSASGFLWSLFLAPAAQFLNEYLRAERGFSGVEITVFLLATNTPGGLGIIVGGRLADRRGRRLLGIVGIIGGVGFTVVSYLTWGWPLWASSVMAALIGSVAIPALGVYGPELFPTGQRGAANGGLQVISVAGSSLGLLAAGWLADRFDALGPAMALLAVGPALLVLLVAIWYPETAHRELEDLNPVDRG
jgi:MFS family permease